MAVFASFSSDTFGVKWMTIKSSSQNCADYRKKPYFYYLSIIEKTRFFIVPLIARKVSLSIGNRDNTILKMLAVTHLLSLLKMSRCY